MSGVAERFPYLCSPCRSLKKQAARLGIKVGRLAFGDDMADAYEVRRKGRHLSYDERSTIERLFRLGCSQTAIAKVVGVSQSTVSRELKKGMVEQLDGSTWLTYKTYSAQKAQSFADYQKTAHGPDLKIGNNRAYLKAVETCVLAGSSPYDALCSVADSNKFEMHISKTTCYRYIKNGLFENLTYAQLPVGHPKKRKGKVSKVHTAHPLHRSIERRSKDISTRKVFGHWEFDSIIGKSDGQGESCLTLTERHSRLEIVLKAKNKTADETVVQMSKLRRYFGKHDFSLLFKTITCDNGSEFAYQQKLDALGTMVFYAHPQAPHERGTNENANKLLRRKFPKGESMKAKTQRDATAAQHFINNYHRQILGGKTALQVFAALLPSLGFRNPQKVARFFGLAVA